MTRRRNTLVWQTRFGFQLVGAAIICTAIICTAILCTAIAQADELVLLDGSKVSATISGIGEDGLLGGDNLPDGLDADGLRQIQTGVTITPPTGRMVLELVDGGRIQTNDITIADEKFTIGLPYEEPDNGLELSLDVVRALRVQAKEGAIDQFENALANPKPNSDRVFLKDGDRIKGVDCFVNKLTASEIEVTRGDQTAVRPLADLVGVVFADLTIRAGEAKSKVHLSDGSVIAGVIASMTDGKLTLKLSRTNSITLPWKHVARIDVRSSRLSFLSDMTPTTVSEQAVVTLHQPWQRDKSVSGGPLTLRHAGGKESRIYSKGLGTHSRCQLKYSTKGSYDSFAATIGIDGATDGRGNCVFVVIGDGNELFSKEVTGKDDAQEVFVDIAGIETVTLVVEPGKDFDLADHANWCDARFLRAKKK